MFNTRQIFAFPLAVAVTFGLFWTMQYLIAVNQSAKIDPVQTAKIDFVRVDREEKVIKSTPQRPKAIDDTPPPPPALEMTKAKPSNTDLTIRIGSQDSGLDIKGGQGYGSDREVLPVVTVAPVYPRSAAARGIEGWVLVELTVAPDGSVLDSRIVDADPTGIFDKAALKAVNKWKYKPKVVNGKAVAQTGVQTVITFTLDK